MGVSPPGGAPGRDDVDVLSARLTWRLVASGVGLALLPLAVTATSAPSTATTTVVQVGRHEHARPGTVDRGRAHRNRARGVSTWWMPDGTTALRRSRASWVYNWSTQPSFPVPEGVRFVPMVWGAAFVTPHVLAAAKAYGPDLLTFNEPELGSQANMSVEQALDLWPALQATGMRLSSPGVTVDARDPHGWLGTFMRKAHKRGLRVDFLALHWYASTYRSNTVRHLRDYLTEVYRRYHKPIWLTEYSLVAHRPQRLVYPRPRVQARFITQSTRMLDRLPFVERYAWFALPAPDDVPSSGLYHADGSPTPAGRAYRHRHRHR